MQVSVVQGLMHLPYTGSPEQAMRENREKLLEGQVQQAQQAQHSFVTQVSKATPNRAIKKSRAEMPPAPEVEATPVKTPKKAINNLPNNSHNAPTARSMCQTDHDVIAAGFV